MIFETAKDLTKFIQNDKDVSVPFAKFEKLEQLSEYKVDQDQESITVANVWNQGESDFVQSYL